LELSVKLRPPAYDRGQLAFGADEEDVVAPQDHFANELLGKLDLLQGFLQVDDVNAVALGKDVSAHLGIPAPRLVAEVDTGLEQLAHGHVGHGTRRPPGSVVPPRASVFRNLLASWPRGTLRGAITRV